jgi:hypothetical protein
MSEGIMARYMNAATHDMIQNHPMEIKCLCQRCKLKCYIDPYSRKLQSHLLSRGFMDGYTRWISDEDNDNVHGAATGNDEEGRMVVTKSLPNMTIVEKMPDMVKKIKMPYKVKKIKMPDMVKKIEMPEQMEHHHVAGCRTLTFQHCFSSKRATLGMPLERKPSWRAWRRTWLLHCMQDVGLGIHVWTSRSGLCR